MVKHELECRHKSVWHILENTPMFGIHTRTTNNEPADKHNIKMFTQLLRYGTLITVLDMYPQVNKSSDTTFNHVNGLCGAKIHLTVVKSSKLSSNQH